MKICLVRTGGVAGMRREVTVDTDRLDAGRAGELRRIVEEAEASGLFAASPAPRGNRPDRFGYHLTIEDRRGRREARFFEDGAPEPASLLVETVWKASEASESTDLRTT
jgi:emfourin